MTDTPIATHTEPERTYHDTETDPPDHLSSPTWTVDSLGEIASAPSIRDGTVYVGAYDNELYAIDAASGDVRWQTELSGEILVARPAVTAETVYAVSYDDLGRDDETIHALDPDDGSIRWTATAYRGSKFSPLPLEDVVLQAATGGGYEDGRLKCLDADDGSTIWETEAGPGSVAVSNETVYVPHGLSLRAFSLLDGEQRWATDIDVDVVTSPLVYRGDIFVGTRKSTVHALDGWTGEQRWTADVFVEEIHAAHRNAFGQTHPRAFAGVSSLAVADERLFVGTYNAVFALDIDRAHEEWVADIDCGRIHAQSVAGNRLLFGADDGGVHGLRPWDGSGSQLAVLEGDARPTAHDGSVYVATTEGRVHRFDT